MEMSATTAAINFLSPVIHNTLEYKKIGMHICVVRNKKHEDKTIKMFYKKI